VLAVLSFSIGVEDQRCSPIYLFVSLFSASELPGALPSPVCLSIERFCLCSLSLAFCPQRREIFLSIPLYIPHVAERPGRWTREGSTIFFPRLAERRQSLGNQIFGGEQQMLAIGVRSSSGTAAHDEPLRARRDASAGPAAADS